MKTHILKALFLSLALSAQAQQAIVCDVAKLNSFPLTITATVDTDVTATILQNGVESPLAGYTGLFYFGDSLGGVTITNSSTGYNTYSWTIPAESTPTNGVYSVQILSAKDGRVKELGRGRMTVRANPSTDYIPVQWQTNNMTYMTAALARDIAIQANATASNALVIANQALGNSAIGTNDVLSLSSGLVDAHNTNTASHLDIRQTASNGLANANEALARENITTNAVNDLSGVLVGNHNASTVSHSDIRASVSNAVDLASGSVKTNSAGGLAVGQGAIASGENSFALGTSTSALGAHSVAMGDYARAEGNLSFALGYYAVALSTHYLSFVWNQDIDNIYYSHGAYTFNINPIGGPSGLYIGETNLQTLLDARLLASDFYSSNSLTASAINALYASNVTTSARIDGKLPATYNSQLHTYDVPLENGVIGQLFQESHVYAMNRSGSTIANGKVVCVSGAQGDNVLIEPASASNPVCTWNVIGLVTEDAGIANNTSGYVTTFGNVNDLNTSMFAISNTLWLAENGNLTNVEPAVVVGKSKIKIGTVIRSHVNEGRIFVSPQVVPNASDVGAATHSETTNAAFYKQVAFSFSIAPTTTVVVTPQKKIYSLTVTNSTVIAFDLSALDTTNQLADWDTWVTIASTNYSVTWPSTNDWYYISTPSSISANSQTVKVVWRKLGSVQEANKYTVR